MLLIGVTVFRYVVRKVSHVYTCFDSRYCDDRTKTENNEREITLCGSGVARLLFTRVPIVNRDRATTKREQKKTNGRCCDDRTKTETNEREILVGVACLQFTCFTKLKNNRITTKRYFHKRKTERSTWHTSS